MCPTGGKKILLCSLLGCRRVSLFQDSPFPRQQNACFRAQTETKRFLIFVCARSLLGDAVSNASYDPFDALALSDRAKGKFFNGYVWCFRQVGTLLTVLHSRPLGSALTEARRLNPDQGFIEVRTKTLIRFAPFIPTYSLAP